MYIYYIYIYYAYVSTEPLQDLQLEFRLGYFRYECRLKTELLTTPFMNFRKCVVSCQNRSRGCSHLTCYTSLTPKIGDNNLAITLVLKQTNIRLYVKVVNAATRVYWFDKKTHNDMP